MSNDIKERIFGLDILRCLAILLVVLCHSTFMLPISESHKDTVMIGSGFAGVEIFFVLSGFLIGRIFLDLLAKESLTKSMVKNFWIRRWFRTLPAYFLCLVLYTGMYYYIEHRSPFSDLYNLLYFAFLQNFVSPAPEFYRVAWSLSVEEWFYLLLPAWVWLFYKLIKMKNAALAGIITCIVAIMLLRVAVVILYDPVWNLGVRAIVPLRLDSLMMGVLTAYIYIQHKEAWIKYARVCFIAGLLVTCAASYWLYIDIIKNPETAGFFSKTLFFNVFSIAVALCMPYMSNIKKASNKIIGEVVTQISLISYSLYLLHTLSMFCYLTLYYKFKLPHSFWIKYPSTWAACLISAYLMYRFFEKPATDLRERFTVRRTVR